MLYRVVANERLFNVWRAFELETKHTLLSDYVQNDMMIDTEELNKAFDRCFHEIQNLSKYSDEGKAPIFKLYYETADYIKQLNRAGNGV